MNNRIGNMLITGVIVFVLALSGYVLLVGLLPYEPYEFIDYMPTQSVACPNEPVRVLVERRIDQDATIDNIVISGSWQEASGITVGDVSAPVGRFDDGGVAQPFPSSAFKTAPLPEGEWYPQGYIEVDGSILGWPRTQIVYASGSIPMTVLPDDDEQCEMKEVVEND